MKEHTHKDTIYLANGLHKAKIKRKISDTVFHAWRNRQGEVVVVAWVYVYCIDRKRKMKTQCSIGDI